MNMLRLLGAAPAWLADGTAHALPNTLPGWTLAFLALQGEWVARERLLALLWPDAATTEAQHNLRVNLHRVRLLLGEWGLSDALQAERRRVRLSLPTDVARVRRAAGEKDLDPTDPGALLASMDFAGFPALQEWAALERQALSSAWRGDLLARLGGAHLDGAGRLRIAQALLAVDPLDEAALLHQLRALREAGRGTEADRVYREYQARLAREFGADPSAAVRALAAPAGSAGALPEAADRRAFVGRRLELAELTRRLADATPRLHTLVGPGGVGKSSLARQVFLKSERAATWIDLQDLEQLDAVAARIAQRLGAELRDGQDPVRAIAASMGAVPRLLVLDNAEHLTGLPDFIAALLAAAPALTVLATSRHPLGIDGEHRLPLEGLARPDDESRDPEAAAAFDAVRLFDLRARAVQPGFAVESHIGAVIDIVEAVGGVPLAIELAAGWVRMLPPEQIARDLRLGLEILERDPATAAVPARPEHASMAVVLERSWQLLSPAARAALLALHVFSGGFDAAAAKTVADAPLPLLAALADAGLLDVGAGGRFNLHPLLASDLAARAAADSPTLRGHRDRHAACFAARMRDLTEHHRDDDPGICATVEADAANLLRAWQHARDAGRDDWFLAFVPAWRRYFEVQGRYAQACRHFGAVIEASALPSGTIGEAHVRAALAHFLVRSNSPALAQPLARQALETAETLGDAPLERTCTSTLGGCAMALGLWDEARAWFERVRALNVQADDARGLAAAWNSLSLVALYSGDSAQALRCAAEARALYERLANHQGVARCLLNTAQVHAAECEWAAAQQAAQSALHHATRHDLAAIANMAEFFLGIATVERGDLDAGVRHLERVHARCATDSNNVFGLKARYYLALAACRRGALDEAAHGLLGAARAAYERGWSEDLLYIAVFVAELLSVAGHAEAADRALRSVLGAPDDVADAAIRRLAGRAMESMPARPSGTDTTAELAFDALSSCLATSDTVTELAGRLRAL